MPPPNKKKKKKTQLLFPLLQPNLQVIETREIQIGA
jgi:hypothetical protein